MRSGTQVLCANHACDGSVCRRDTLILSRNSLSSLPDEIKNCANLRVLQLDGNELTELPSAEVWASITKLESVDFSSNKLTSDQLDKMKGVCACARARARVCVCVCARQSSLLCADHLCTHV